MLLSIDGFFLFGIAVKMVPKLGPMALQQQSYPATNNIESLAMGRRGGESMISGRLSFDTEFQLKQGQAILNKYNDGLPHLIIQIVQNGVGFTAGVSYLNCLVMPIDWDKRYTFDDSNGWTIGYSMVIQHLTSSGFLLPL